MRDTKMEYSSDRLTPVVLPKLEELLPPHNGEQFFASKKGILEDGCYTPIISAAYSGKKRRLNIVLSMENPLQREAWAILAQSANKTGAICEEVCGYYKRKSWEETLRSILREELKTATILCGTTTEEAPAPTVDSAVLDFLQALQDG